MNSCQITEGLFSGKTKLMQGIRMKSFLYLSRLSLRHRWQSEESRLLSVLLSQGYFLYSSDLWLQVQLILTNSNLWLISESITIDQFTNQWLLLHMNCGFRKTLFNDLSAVLFRSVACPVVLKTRTGSGVKFWPPLRNSEYRDQNHAENRASFSTLPQIKPLKTFSE